MNKAIPTLVSLLLAATAVPALASDEVFVSDVIIEGSLCVGFDCADGEAFSFDTIRLKENNLRIHFEDTSTTGGYASNDWRISINENALGGAEKFSIDDLTAGTVPFTVEGGAPSFALFVDDDGRIGLGTSTPQTEIHMIDNDSPTVRFEQDGSLGFGAQIWDLAGNEQSFFVRDVTHDTKLPFRIEPDAPGSALHVKSDGAVGLGTDAPEAFLHLASASKPASILFEHTASGVRWQAGIGSLSSDPHVASVRDDFVIYKPSPAGPGGGLTPVDGKGQVVFGISERGHVFLKGDQIHPDYVFEPGYELMPLDELERFVRQEKRLPRFPSAETIGAQGLDLNQFVAGLLEKIEELTLHVIEQDKRIAELEENL